MYSKWISRYCYIWWTHSTNAVWSKLDTLTEIACFLAPYHYEVAMFLYYWKFKVKMEHQDMIKIRSENEVPDWKRVPIFKELNIKTFSKVATWTIFAISAVSIRITLHISVIFTCGLGYCVSIPVCYIHFIIVKRSRRIRVSKMYLYILFISVRLKKTLIMAVINK